MVRLPREVVPTFVLRFAIAAGIMLALYYFPYEGRAMRGLLGVYLGVYAKLAGGAVGLFDRSVHVTGTHIVGRMAMDFALSCDAMDVYILFAAATVAFPARWRSRASALLPAFGALILLNVLRIVTLYFIGVYFPSRFELFHMQIWPLIIVVLATGSFLAWARTSTMPKGPAGPKTNEAPDAVGIAREA
jgi:exosortase/archaeosortase family protein